MSYSRLLGMLTAFSLYIAISLSLYKPPVTYIPEVLPYAYFHNTPTDLPAPKPKQTSKQSINSYLESRFGLPKGILFSIHQKETSGRCKIDSKANAKGCFQFMDITILDIKQRFNYSFDPYNYEQSAKAAALKLKYLYNRFAKNYKANTKVLWALTLAAYNAGYGTVTRKGWTDDLSTYSALLKNITFKETQNYVKTIIPKLF
jgi:soluble lytic murein transglycosylase-like protein